MGLWRKKAVKLPKEREKGDQENRNKREKVGV
jgi:hypothetical protein